MSTQYVPPPTPKEIGYPWFVNVADPALGVSSVILTLPDIEAEWFYRIHSISFRLQTSGAMTARWATIRLFHHAGSPGTLWELSHADSQPGNLTVNYVFFCGTPAHNISGNAWRVASVPALPMNGNLRVATKVNTMDSGDQISNIWYHLSIYQVGSYKVPVVQP